MRRFKTKISALLCAVFLVMGMGTTAMAAESYQVTIPAVVAVSGTGAPQNEVYTLVLEAVDNAPLPEETELSVTGAGTVSFGPVTYTTPGDYNYKVTQKAGSTENMTYDTAVIDVTVRVLCNEEGNLEANIWAIRDGNEQKLDEIKFTNTYTEPEKKTVTHIDNTKKSTPKTGDTSEIYMWSLITGTTVLLLAALLIVGFRRKKKLQGE